MQVVLELSLAYPFAAPSALRIFYNPQYPAGTFPQRPSEVYTPAHGVCMTFGTHLQVSQRNIVRTPWTLIPSRCKPETKLSSTSHESGVVAFRQTRWLYLPCPWPCRRVSGCADCTKRRVRAAALVSGCWRLPGTDTLRCADGACCFSTVRTTRSHARSLVIQDMIHRVIVAASTERLPHRLPIWELRPRVRSFTSRMVHTLTSGTRSGRAGHYTLLCCTRTVLCSGPARVPKEKSA